MSTGNETTILTSEYWQKEANNARIRLADSEEVRDRTFKICKDQSFQISTMEKDISNLEVYNAKLNRFLVEALTLLEEYNNSISSKNKKLPAKLDKLKQSIEDWVLPE